MLVDFVIDKARYHSGDLEGTSIVPLFKNTDKIFEGFSIIINKIITTEKQKIEVNEYTNWYFEICTLFDSLSSISRKLCSKMTKEIINKLKIFIKRTLSCWINLRLSMKTIKIHRIEDH